METICSPHSRMRSSGGPPFSALSTHWNSGTFQGQALPQFERQRPRRQQDTSRLPSGLWSPSRAQPSMASAGKRPMSRLCTFPWPELGHVGRQSIMCLCSRFSYPPPFVQDRECQLSQHLTPSPMSKAKCHLLHDGLLDSTLPPTSTG